MTLSTSDHSRLRAFTDLPDSRSWANTSRPTIPVAPVIKSMTQR
jgi:hypothetical protein